MAARERKWTMASQQPTTDIDVRFSSPGAEARSWSEAEALLDAAQIYWLTTVRADGRPHVTPLLAIWLDGALYFSTGEEEQKARNIVANQHCVATTGCNTLNSGLDIVIEGTAQRVTDLADLQRLAALYESKHGWTFIARDGALHGDDAGEHRAIVYRIVPAKVLGFGKGEPFSQTRWRFQ
jgi:nitroimidazol reductase NimA-like FMN-containing flavoprotein (pyridoxamine 5'-phosphate oxidase superfamily)